VTTRNSNATGQKIFRVLIVSFFAGHFDSLWEKLQCCRRYNSQFEYTQEKGCTTD